MWKSSLLKFASWFLAVFSCWGLLRILGMYLSLDIGALKIMPTQMQSPLMLWHLIPPAILLLILAHTPPGRTKVVRVLIGVYSVIIIYLHVLYFVWSIVGPNIYYPALKMNLDLIAGKGYVAQASRLFIVSPALLLLGIFGFAIVHAYREPKFWDHLINASLEFPGFGIQGRDKREESTDLIICAHHKTKKSVLWKEGDQPMNLGIIGPVGSGKTSRSLLPILSQILLILRMGLFVIEPKGDLVERLAILASKTGRRVVFVDPANPESPVFNPLHGDDIDKIAEINSMTIRATFGHQEAYFANKQEEALKQMIALLKYTKGNDCTYRDLYNYLLNEKLVVNEMKTLSLLIVDPNNLDDPRVELREWFNLEYIGNEKMREAVDGLRGHLKNMVGNRYFRRVACGKSEIDMVEGIRNGDIFLFSTSDTVLGERLSKTFGALILQHYQAALLTRGIIPVTEPERRQYKLSVLCADEFGGYVNEEFGSFISKSRGYGGVNILAMQTINQLKEVGRGNNVAFQQKVLGQLRSKIVFGGLEIVQSDADYFSKSFGTEDQEIVTTRTGTSRGKTSFFFPDSIQDGDSSMTKEMTIHRATDIRYMPKGVVMYQIMKDQSLQLADKGLVSYFDNKEKHMGGAYWFMSKEFEKKAKILRKRLESEKQMKDTYGHDREKVDFKTLIMRKLSNAGVAFNQKINPGTMTEPISESYTETDPMQEISGNAAAIISSNSANVKLDTPLPPVMPPTTNKDVRVPSLDRDEDLFGQKSNTTTTSTPTPTPSLEKEDTDPLFG